MKVPYYEKEDPVMKKNKVKYLFLLSSISTCSIAIINNIFHITATNQNYLLRKGNYYNWHHGKVFYTVQGSGSPLLLIHDCRVYSNLNEWDQMIDNLSQNHKVYAIDLLGCGRSEKPLLTYTAYLYVQLISDFINDIIKSPVNIITSGDSSIFALASAAKSKDNFNKIILINPAKLCKPSFENEKFHALNKYIHTLPVIGTFLYNIKYCRTNLAKILSSEFNSQYKLDRNYIEECYESLHKKNELGRYLSFSIDNSYMCLNDKALLKSCSDKISIIGGKEENNVYETLRNYMAVDSDIKCQIIDSSKHYPQLENPDKTLLLINEILNAD